MKSDLIPVFYASSVSEADVMAAWLEEQDVRTFVKDRHAAAMLQTPLMIAPKGIAVCVGNEADAQRARQLLDHHFEMIRRRNHPAENSRQIATFCESCGTTSMLPFDQRGSVQNCPKCHEYVDVPESE